MQSKSRLCWWCWKTQFSLEITHLASCGFLVYEYTTHFIDNLQRASLAIRICSRGGKDVSAFVGQEQGQATCSNFPRNRLFPTRMHLANMPGLRHCHKLSGAPRSPPPAYLSISFECSSADDYIPISRPCALQFRSSYTLEVDAPVHVGRERTTSTASLVALESRTQVLGRLVWGQRTSRSVTVEWCGFRYPH